MCLCMKLVVLHHRATSHTRPLPISGGSAVDKREMADMTTDAISILRCPTHTRAFAHARHARRERE